MHTISVVVGGLVLLGFMLAIAKVAGASRATTVTVFLAVWLAAALVNMWIGVTRAGYTVGQELPILLVVFGVPAAAAILARRRWPD